MLTCYRSRRRLGAYLDGEVPAPERARIASHLDGCSTCRGRVDELQRLQALLIRVAVKTAEPDWTGFWPGIVRGIEDRRRSVTAVPRRIWTWRPRLAFGGMLAAAVLATLTVWEMTRAPVVPAASVIVNSADTEHPGGTVMVYSPPEHDMAVVWIFGDD